MARRFPSGARVEIFDTLDSTSLEARRRADGGEKGPLWLIALRQTAGYGRRGSAWMQQPGDVAATFLFEPQTNGRSVAELSFVAAIATAAALRHCAPRAGVAVKWPNDILADGGKIAGLLLELLSAPPAPPLIAVGVGVNVVSAPANLVYPTARLIDFAAGDAAAPRALVETIDAKLDFWTRRWTKDGFADIRAEWLSIAAGLGETIQVKTPGEIVEGVFADLDLDGALILDCDGVQRKIAAGAVLPSR